MIERLQFSFITNYYHSAKQSLKQSIIIHNPQLQWLFIKCINVNLGLIDKIQSNLILSFTTITTITIINTSLISSDSLQSLSQNNYSKILLNV